MRKSALTPTHPETLWEMGRKFKGLVAVSHNLREISPLGAPMDDRLRDFIQSLHMLAGQRGAADVGVLTAEMEIKAFLQRLSGKAWRSARNSILAEAKARQNESNFWRVVKERINSLPEP